MKKTVPLSIQEKVYNYRHGHDVALLTQIHRYHDDILVAIARTDPQQAMHLLGEHIRLSKD